MVFRKSFEETISSRKKMTPHATSTEGLKKITMDLATQRISGDLCRYFK